MSDMSDDWGFAPPPFKAEAALLQLRRSLRDCRLAERGDGFELRGRRVVELELDAVAGTIRARLARRPMVTPEWDRFAVTSAGDQRRLVEEVRRRLSRWETDE